MESNRYTRHCAVHDYDSRDNGIASIKRSFRLRRLWPTLDILTTGAG